MINNIKLGAFAGVGLLLASCAMEDPIAFNENDDIISYSVISDNQTRAAQSFCANFMPDEIKVYAYLDDGTPYIDGDRIVRYGDTWAGADGVRHWPLDNSVKMDFYALINDNGKYASTADGGSIVDWSVLPDVEQQQDLMYAGIQNVTKRSTVALNFRHALSQICYQAMNETSNIQITVNSITVGNVAGTGTFSLPVNADTSGNFVNHEDTDADEVNDEGVVFHNGWATSGSPKSFVVGLGSQSGGTWSGVTLDNGKRVVTNISNVSDNEGEQWFEKALMMIPQSVQASEAAVDTDPATGAFFKLNLTAVQNGTTTTKDYYAPIDLDWEPGTRYVYTFRFPSDWTPSNNKTIDVVVDDEELPDETGNILKGVLNNPSSDVSLSILGNSYTLDPDGTGYFEVNILGDITQISNWFNRNDSYSLLDFSSFDTSNVTDMSSMFSRAKVDRINLDNVVTSNVKNMSWMFAECSGLTSLDLNSFDTSNVTDMSWMFDGCSGLTDILCNFDTSNVYNMTGMFYDCSSMTDLDFGFDTSKVVEMSWMFAGCSGLTSIDVPYTNIKCDVQGMFAGCSNLTDIYLPFSDVYGLDEMFYGCYSLESVDVSNIEVYNSFSLYQAFEFCYNLKYITCKQAFRDYCIQYGSRTGLPDAFMDPNYEGWCIVD